jgi:hypothetical protein
MNPNIKTGFLMGTGAAINVELGWIPDLVLLSNLTDGDIIHVWHRARVAAFTSGGTATPQAGDVLQGDTSGVRVRIKAVFLKSGTFAGGDAAGDFVFYEEDETGTLGSENVSLLPREDGSGVSQSNVATVTAQAEKGNLGITSEVASVTPANGVQPYVGSSAAAARGFTVTATASEAAKLFAYTAFRDGAGA